MADYDMDSAEQETAYLEMVEKAGGIAKMSAIPDCNFCKLEGKVTPAKYDFCTTAGYWAYGCQEHFSLNHRFDSLGTGKGQLLVLASDND